MTDSAANALKDARADQGIPEDFGVRIAAEQAQDGQVNLAIGFSEEPFEGDEVTEQAGVDLYVATEVSDALAESVIDIDETPQGEQLVIRPQDESA